MDIPKGWFSLDNINWVLNDNRASLVTQRLKRLPAMRETGFNPWVGKIPWNRKWQPTPVLLPGKFHGQRSLAGDSPWGRKQSDMTERLTLSLRGWSWQRWLMTPKVRSSSAFLQGWLWPPAAFVKICPEWDSDPRVQGLNVLCSEQTLCVSGCTRQLDIHWQG